MSLKECIEKKFKELVEKMDAKDFQAASKLYTEDCVVMPSTGEIIVGRNDLVKYRESAFGEGEFEFSTKLLEISGDENGFVLSRGSFAANAVDGSYKGGGNFLSIWKRVNGEFQISHDIWNAAKSQ